MEYGTITRTTGAPEDTDTQEIPRITGATGRYEAATLLDATMKAWDMLSPEFNAARGDDWEWIRLILRLTEHTTLLQPVGDEPVVYARAAAERWPGRWRGVLHDRVCRIIGQLAIADRIILEIDPGMWAHMPDPGLCDRVRRRHDPNEANLALTLRNVTRW